MQLPDEKSVKEKIKKIKNNYTKSIEHMNVKFKKIDELKKTFMEHLKACDELKQGMPFPGDPRYQNTIVVLDNDQRKKLEKFKKHVKIMHRCKERMNILLKQVNTEAENTKVKTVSAITKEENNIKSIMMDIIKEDSYRLAKEEIDDDAANK